MGPHQIVRGLRAILLEDLHEQRVDTRVIAEELYIQQQHWLQTRKALEKKIVLGMFHFPKEGKFQPKLVMSYSRRRRNITLGIFG